MLLDKGQAHLAGSNAGCSAKQDFMLSKKIEGYVDLGIIPTLIYRVIAVNSNPIRVVKNKARFQVVRNFLLGSVVGVSDKNRCVSVAVRNIDVTLVFTPVANVNNCSIRPVRGCTRLGASPLKFIKINDLANLAVVNGIVLSILNPAIVLADLNPFNISRTVE